MSNLEFIYKRKSIRQFKDEKVPYEDIVKILEAATYAPSPKHQQNWHFVVIQNRGKIDEIAEAVTKSHTHIASLARTEEEKKQFMSVLKYYLAFQKAPVVIIVYARPYDMIEENILRANNADPEIIETLISTQSNAQGIGAAVENLLLAAADMGYGTCYMTGPTHGKTEIEKIVGFSKECYSLMSMVALGKPAEKTFPQPPRKPLEKVVTFID